MGGPCATAQWKVALRPPSRRHSSLRGIQTKPAYNNSYRQKRIASIRKRSAVADVDGNPAAGFKSESVGFLGMPRPASSESRFAPRDDDSNNSQPALGAGFVCDIADGNARYLLLPQ